LVIGGLMVTEEISRRTGVPILMHIPLLNYFFSRTTKTQNEAELLLVVSPRLVHASPKGTEVRLPGVEEQSAREATPMRTAARANMAAHRMATGAEPQQSIAPAGGGAILQLGSATLESSKEATARDE
jgi:type II secretory pathway component GspD/PulD (secretin)